MKIRKYTTGILAGMFMVSILALTSCEEYLEIPGPTNSLSTETAFESKGVIDGMMNAMYTSLNGLSTMGLYYAVYVEAIADNYYNPTVSQTVADLQSGLLLPNNSTPVALAWTEFYRLINLANLLIEGLPGETATDLDNAKRDEYMGAALTCRAHAHYMLVRLWSDVPLVTSSDIFVNLMSPRTPAADVYDQVIADLTKAISLMPTTIGDPRYINNRNIPQALLARVYTTMGRWAEAEAAANDVIGVTSYQIVTNPRDVFYRGSKEIISSLGSISSVGGNYDKAPYMALLTMPYSASYESLGAALSPELLNAFEDGDLRKTTWTILKNKGNYVNPENRYFSNKYEYSPVQPGLVIPAGQESDVVFIRLAEMYLIRAEARARKASPDLAGAASDLNVIRTRAGLPNTTAATQEELIDAVIKERRVELFFEGGHRWDDLVRTGLADQVISPLPWKVNWAPHTVKWPIPESERYKNPNLTQNDGY